MNITAEMIGDAIIAFQTEYPSLFDEMEKRYTLDQVRWSFGCILAAALKSEE